MSHFQTPDWVRLKMIELIPINAKTILEPTPGDGLLVTTLEAHGYDVIAPHHFYVFYMGNKNSKYDAIVMNILELRKGYQGKTELRFG